MWPFSKKQKPIWKLVSREFIGEKRNVSNYNGYIDVDTFKVYAATYVDVISGKKVIREEHELA